MAYVSLCFKKHFPKIPAIMLGVSSWQKFDSTVSATDIILSLVPKLLPDFKRHRLEEGLGNSAPPFIYH